MANYGTVLYCTVVIYINRTMVELRSSPAFSGQGRFPVVGLYSHPECEGQPPQSSNFSGNTRCHPRLKCTVVASFHLHQRTGFTVRRGGGAYVLVQCSPPTKDASTSSIIPNHVVAAAVGATPLHHRSHLSSAPRWFPTSGAGNMLKYSRNEGL